MVEQFVPGWHATIDGRQVPIERRHEAFQSIQMPAGDHRVVFAFNPSSVPVGAFISIMALAGLIAMVYLKKKQKQ